MLSTILVCLPWGRWDKCTNDILWDMLGLEPRLDLLHLFFGLADGLRENVIRVRLIQDCGQGGQRSHAELAFPRELHGLGKAVKDPGGIEPIEGHRVRLSVAPPDHVPSR